MAVQRRAARLTAAVALTIGAPALLTAIVGCRRRESPLTGTTVGTVQTVGHGTAIPTAERAATMPTASAALDIVPGRVVQLALVTERASSDETWTVIANVPSLSIQTPVTSFKEPSLCGVVPFFGRVGGLPRSNVGTQQEPESIGVSCSASAPLIELTMRDGHLMIGETKFSLPPNTHLAFPSEVQQGTLSECDSTRPVQTVDVQMVRRRAVIDGVGKGKLEMVLLAAGRMLWSDVVGDVPMSCHSSRVFPKSSQVSYGCSFGESGYHLDVRWDHRRIWVDFVETGYKPTLLKQRFGTQLPCGAKVRFFPFSQRDPKWKAYGSPCASACRDQWTHCEDRCYQNHADDEGTLSESGLRCTGACHKRMGDCDNTCASRGQYP